MRTCQVYPDGSIFRILSVWFECWWCCIRGGLVRFDRSLKHSNDVHKWLKCGIRQNYKQHISVTKYHNIDVKQTIIDNGILDYSINKYIYVPQKYEKRCYSLRATF